MKSMQFEEKGSEGWWNPASKGEGAGDMQVEVSSGEIIRGL